jgi:hypothetical protein
LWPWRRLEQLRTVATGPPGLIDAATALLLAAAAVALVLLLERLARERHGSGPGTESG